MINSYEYQILLVLNSQTDRVMQADRMQSFADSLNCNKRILRDLTQKSLIKCRWEDSSEPAVYSITSSGLTALEEYSSWLRAQEAEERRELREIRAERRAVAGEKRANIAIAISVASLIVSAVALLMR